MPRTVAPEGTDRREEILRAALEVFAERDFAEATTKAIAEKAGVTQGLIYFYFPGGKEELFRAAFQHEAQRSLATPDLTAELEAGGPPEAALRSVIARLLAVMEGPFGADLVRITMKAQMCTMRPDDRYAERYRPMRAIGEPVSRALRSYLDEQVARGTLRPMDSDLTAHLITSTLLIVMLRRAQPGDPLAQAPRDALVDSMAELFLHGLCARASAAVEDAGT